MHTRSTLVRHHLPPVFFSFLAGLVGAGSLAAAPVISEIVASNQETLVDEDGEASDWLEIYNPDATAADLSGWHLTDNRNNAAKWTFPPGVTLGPREFLVVWASSKNRTADPARLHTNFSLSANGEYLALVQPDGTRASEYSPAFPALQEDESYGIPFVGETALAAGATAHIHVPANEALGQAWTQPAFTPGSGWTSGPGHVGFGVPTPGFYIEEKISSSTLTTLTTAENLLNSADISTLMTRVTRVVNFVGDAGTDGRFEDGSPFLHGGDPSNLALRATGTLVVPQGGPWTFCVNSDEGFRLKIGNVTVMSFTGRRTPVDTFVTRTSLAAGNHAIELTYFEADGGDEVELSAAPGTHDSFSSFFKLIGDTANGGLPVLAPVGKGTPIVATDIGAAMLNTNASAYIRLPFTLPNPAELDTLELSIAYNDGFIAYLNGTEVARRNAPAAASYNAAAPAERPLIHSIAPEKINLSAHLPGLSAGAQTLAIHGLNRSAADSSFLIAPTLAATRRLEGAPRFFRAPTPGAANTTTGFLGHVAETSFSPRRGMHTAPIDVTITSATPGAVIRYTTNGSTPSPSNGEIYTGPIPVSQTTVIRAAAFLDGHEPTLTDTHTYLFLDDVIFQGGPTAPYRAKPGPEWPNLGSSAGQVIDYGMDRSIVNSTNTQIGGQARVKEALAAIPSVCVTTDVPNLFHTTTGIYNHPGNHGRLWERVASIEMLNDPNTADRGFHAQCGIRIRGGYSRSTDNPKHAFRVFFRGDYGTSRLDYPVFGAVGAGEFDAFDLQCSQNYSWSFHGDANHNALREIWSRDSQRDLGWQGTRGRFVHLYLNGTYWGLYQIQERANADFGETYLGGNADNYDVIKHTGNNAGYTTEATDGYLATQPDGTDAAWRRLWQATRASYWINTDKNPASPAQTLVSTPQEKLAAYYKVSGLQADGKTPSGEPRLLEVDNLIDYMLVTLYARNADAPITSGGDRPNNFYAMRERGGPLGFIQIQHDGEHSMNAGGANDRWGPFTDARTGSWSQFQYSNPQYFHQDLSGSAEYRMRFADRIYRAFYNNGPLTLAANQARLDRRAAEVESAIIAESARWGDSKTSPARNATHWRSARTATRNWLSTRQPQFVTEARAKGFYPNIEPPTFSPAGGTIIPGATVALANPNAAGGAIYYTTDGSDPRPVGGGFIPSVLVPEFATASYLCPSETNGGSTLTRAEWTTAAAPPNSANWASGPLGFGFTPVTRTDYTPYIKTNIQHVMQPSGGTANASLYVRIPFTLTQEQIGSIDNLRLRVRFDDAYVAYLNGQEIGRRTVTAAFSPQWNSSSGTARSNALAITQDALEIANVQGRLIAGDNMLAFHVMNSTAANDDVLFSPMAETDSLSGAVGSAYASPIALSSSATIKARVLHGTTWSALHEAAFFTDSVPASSNNIVVSEFSYNPSGAQTAAEAAFSSNDFEFIELQNISSANVDLYNVGFSGAVTYTLGAAPQQLVLPPGGRIAVVANTAAFTARYGAVSPVAGPFEGSLDNSGETIRITGADGAIIKEFTYGTHAPWPESADGDGYSLVLVNPSSNPIHAEPASWRTSAAKNGHPTAAKGSTYTAWKAAHGSPADDDDSDRDGLTAFMEYALGGSPSASDALDLPRAGIEPFTVNGTTADYLTLRFHRRLAADDVQYLVETSASLQEGSWTPGGATAGGETNLENGAAEQVLRSLQPVTPGQPLYLRLRLSLRP